MTTIGVFDSGVGGLTVLREMLPRFPGARFLYLGDTARLPYGSKSQETIARYAVSAARFLEDSGAEHLVIACNTASALALPQIRAAARVPVFGVIESGAEAARQASQTGDVLVIGTEATVQSHAYAAALAEKGLRALELACPLFVPLIEEGWQDHAVAREVAAIYLESALAQAHAAGLRPDTLLLGCTHYPLLRATLREVLPPGITITDAAACTAERVAEALTHTNPVIPQGAKRPQESAPPATTLSPPPSVVIPQGAQRPEESAPPATSLPSPPIAVIPQGAQRPEESAAPATPLSPPPSVVIPQGAQRPEESAPPATTLPSPPSVVIPQGAKRPEESAPPATEPTPQVHFYATDSVTKFQQLGTRFLGQPITGVTHVRFPE